MNLNNHFQIDTTLQEDKNNNYDDKLDDLHLFEIYTFLQYHEQKSHISHFCLTCMLLTPTIYHDKFNNLILINHICILFKI